MMETAKHAPHVDQFRPIAAPFDVPLAPTSIPEELSFDRHGLGAVRRFVEHRAQRFGLSSSRVTDLIIAVNELATNSVRHGGGEGTVRVWSEPSRVVCEVTDHGRIREPLVVRRPLPGQERGMGLWLVHQLCDLVQVWTLDSGSVVRMHVATPS